MLNHHARTCDFSGANLPWVYAQGVFPCSIGFSGPPIHDHGEQADGWGPASCDPMFILWEPFRVLTVASLYRFSAILHDVRSFARFARSCMTSQVFRAPSSAGIRRGDGGKILRYRKPRRKEKSRLTRCGPRDRGFVPVRKKKRKASPLFFSSTILPISSHKCRLLRPKAVSFLRTLVVWVSAYDSYRHPMHSDLFSGGDRLVC